MMDFFAETLELIFFLIVAIPVTTLIIKFLVPRIAKMRNKQREKRIEEMAEAIKRAK